MKPSIHLSRWLLVLWFSGGSLLVAEGIYLGAKVNGTPVRFAFDTGSGLPSVLWHDVAQVMAVKTSAPDGSNGNGVDGKLRLMKSEPVEFGFLGARFPGVSLPVIDVFDFAKWDVQGLIGWPALRNDLWEFDVSRRGSRTLDRLPEDIADWLKYPLVKDASVLAIEVPLPDGGHGLLAIDTGLDDDIELAPRLWIEWKSAHPGAPVTLAGRYMLRNGFSVLEVMAAEHWSIDRLNLAHVLLSQAHPDNVAAFGPRYLATFGIGALKKLTLIVDEKAGFAYFRPLETASPYRNYNRLGAEFGPTADQPDAYFARVSPGTPAALAGIHDGDRLLKINGVEVEHWRRRPMTWPPRNFFNQAPGAAVDLTIEHDRQKTTKHVVLQSILNPEASRSKDTGVPMAKPDFHFLPPSGKIVQRAKALGVATGAIALSNELGPVWKDDRTAVVVTVVDDNEFQQWLMTFAGAELKAGENKSMGILKLYTSSGRALTFDRTPMAIAIRTVGPFTEGRDDGTLRDESSTVVITKEFLSMGFDSAALAVRKLGTVPGGHIGFRNRAFPTKESAAERVRLEAGGFGAEDERAFVGGGEAAMEFFRIASQAPGVRDILRRLLDLSWKDYLQRPNIDVRYEPYVNEIPSDWWGLPPGIPCRSFCFQVNLNGSPKLLIRVAACRPVRPIQTVAGVVGMAVGRVDGSGPHVMVRLLSAHPAGLDAAK